MDYNKIIILLIALLVVILVVGGIFLMNPLKQNSKLEMISNVLLILTVLFQLS